MNPALIITVLCTLMSLGAYPQEKTLKIEGQITNIPDGARMAFMQIEKTKFTQLGKAEIKDGRFLLIHSFPEDTTEPFVITIQCKAGEKKLRNYFCHITRDDTNYGKQHRH